MSSTDVSTHSPLVPINSNDHSGYIVFTIYGPLFVALAFWTTRLAIRWRRLRPRLDDLFLILAFVSTSKGRTRNRCRGGGRAEEGTLDWSSPRECRSRGGGKVAGLCRQTVAEQAARCTRFSQHCTKSCIVLELQKLTADSTGPCNSPKHMSPALYQCRPWKARWNLQ